MFSERNIMNLKFCSLASGSSGNCHYVATDETGLLVDAGLSGKYIKGALENIDVDITTITGLLVTHEHSDHIKGIGVLMRRYGIPLYITEETWKAMSCKIGKIDEKKVIFISKNEEVEVGNIVVKSYEVSHDAVDPVGYTFRYGNSKISIVTDLGHITDEIMDEIKDSDLLLIESNHDEEMLKMGSYPYYLKRRILSELGHLSNSAAGEIVVNAVKRGRVKNVLLGHLSKENNFPELAFETVKNIVEASSIEVGVDINIDMAYRDRVSRFYNIKQV